MPKNIYMYTGFYSDAAEDIAKQIDELDGEPFTLRVNSVGGRTSAGAAILAKLAEANAEKIVVDGDASSMAAFVTIYAEKVEANELSEFMFHKAGYPSYYEPTEQEKKSADALNKRLKKQMLKKGIDAEFVNSIFADGERVDHYLTAQEALSKGVVSKVTKIGKVALGEHRAKAAKLALAGASSHTHTTKNSNIMNLAELRAQHPALVAQAVDEAVKTAVAAERERTSSLLVCVKTADNSAAKLAIEAVKNGDTFMSKMAEINQLQLAEMQVKQAEAENVDAIDAGEANPAKDAEDAAAGATEKTAYKKDEDSVFELLGINAKQ